MVVRERRNIKKAVAKAIADQSPLAMTKAQHILCECKRRANREGAMCSVREEKLIGGWILEAGESIALKMLPDLVCAFESFKNAEIEDLKKVINVEKKATHNREKKLGSLVAEISELKRERVRLNNKLASTETKLNHAQDKTDEAKRKMRECGVK